MINIQFHSPAGLPADEGGRQAAVDRSGMLKRRSDPRLQSLVNRAAKLFSTPIAAISIIDRDRQLFAARTGLALEETPRAVSFCAHAIHRPGEALVVRDATQDARFQGNPLVLSAPHMRFYAGIPLVDLQGYPLGALCVIDPQPRDEEPDLFELQLLAREVEHLIAR